MDVKIVRNNTNFEKWVVHRGRRCSLSPNTTLPFPAELAELFVDRCKPAVTYAKGLNTVYDEKYAGPRRWVYNRTGNPDEPETIDISAPTRGEPDRVKTVPNPFLKANILKFEYDGGQPPGRERLTGKETSFNMPLRTVELWPYTRRSLPDQVANDWLRRDGARPDGRAHMIRAATPPGGFEPDNTWTYEDIQLYADLIDTNMDKGPKRTKLKSEVDVDVAKHVLLHRLYFRVCDPRYMNPTREDFESVGGAKPAPDLEDTGELTQELKDANAEIARLRTQLQSPSSQKVRVGRPPGPKTRKKTTQEAETTVP